MCNDANSYNYNSYTTITITITINNKANNNSSYVRPKGGLPALAEHGEPHLPLLEVPAGDANSIDNHIMMIVNTIITNSSIIMNRIINNPIIINMIVIGIIFNRCMFIVVSLAPAGDVDPDLGPLRKLLVHVHVADEPVDLILIASVW